MILIHLNLFFFKLSHVLALKLLGLKLYILPRKLFLLKKAKLFRFLQLANLLTYPTISLRCKLLSEGLDLPLEALVYLFNLLLFCALER